MRCDSVGLDWILTDFGRVRRFLGCPPGLVGPLQDWK